MTQEVIGGLLVVLLTYGARQVHLILEALRGMRRDQRHDRRLNRRRFVLHEQRLDDHEDRLDEHDDLFADLKSEKDHGQEGPSGEADANE